VSSRGIHMTPVLRTNSAQSLPLEFTKEYTAFANLSEARSALYGLMSRGYALFRDAELQKAEYYGDVGTWQAEKVENFPERRQDEDHDTNHGDDGEAEGYPDLFRPTYLKAFSGIIRYKCECDILDCKCKIEPSIPNSEKIDNKEGINDKEESDYQSLTVGHTGLIGLVQFKCGCGDDQNCDCHGDPTTTLAADLVQRQQTISHQSAGNHPLHAALDLRMRQRELEIQLCQWYDAFQQSIPTMKDVKVEASSSLMMYYHGTGNVKSSRS